MLTVVWMWWQNEVLKEALSSCRHVSVIASEEEDGELELRPDGEYVVVYDPLDGSSVRHPRAFLF